MSKKFELVPVTEKPTIAGKYLMYKNGEVGYNMLWDDKKYGDKFDGWMMFVGNFTHYLRPVEEQQAPTREDMQWAIAIEALENIANNEGGCCQRCEGNGKLWADGKAHLPSYGGPTVNCGECGGSGRIYEDIQSIASEALDKIESAPASQDKGEVKQFPTDKTPEQRRISELSTLVYKLCNLLEKYNEPYLVESSRAYLKKYFDTDFKEILRGFDAVSRPHQTASAGVWVKASDRLPNKRGLYYCRTLHKNDRPDEDNIMRDLRVYEPSTEQWKVSSLEPSEVWSNVIEWLDESAPEASTIEDKLRNPPPNRLNEIVGLIPDLPFQDAPEASEVNPAEKEENIDTSHTQDENVNISITPSEKAELLRSEGDEDEARDILNTCIHNHQQEMRIEASFEAKDHNGIQYTMVNYSVALEAMKQFAQHVRPSSAQEAVRTTPFNPNKCLQEMMRLSGNEMVERKPTWGKHHEVIIAQNTVMDAFIEVVMPEIQLLSDLQKFIELYKERRPSV